MSLFQRVFKIGQAEAHAVVNKLEDPIKMTEQGIRDLKTDLQAALQSLAEVKGIAFRLQKDATDQGNRANEYERKAQLLLQQGSSGALPALQADSLATQALTQMEQAKTHATAVSKDAETQQRMASQLQEKIGQLKTTIQTYENELITLTARAKTAASTKKINQQLAQVDSSSTVAMLERMKQRVEEDEALSQAYGEVAEQNAPGGGLDAEINRALAASNANVPSDRLLEMKRKMGLLT